MRIRFLLLSAFLLQNVLLRAQIPLAVQQRLQDTIDHIRAARNYKGISAAVSWRGHGKWKGTAGLSHFGAGLTDSNVICIGSNTKTYLASAMLRLAELGMVSLSDSVGKWLAPMPFVKGSITVRQLLQHTSGLYNYTENAALGDSINANPWRVWSKAELVSKFIKAPLFNPGQSWYYSNTNYLVAGMIAELAGGRDVAELIRDLVLAPIGASNTFFPPYETVTSSRAHAWSDYGNGYLQSQDLPAEFYSVADAAGGMLSDAADNCLFWEGLFNGAIIQKSTLRNEMMSWKPIATSFSYGLGLMKQSYLSSETYGHGGSILGQFCLNLSDTARGITISVLTNQDSLQNDPILLGLYKILLQQSKLVPVTEHSADTDDLIFPNPATTEVRITTGAPLGSVTLRDVSGRPLADGEVTGSTARVNIESLPAGVYFVMIRDAGGQRVRKVVKE